MRGKWIITLTLAAGLCIATYAKALVTEPPLENPAPERNVIDIRTRRPA